MGVESNHVEYSKYSKAWARCEDAVEGADAIKAKSTTYLPKLPAMDMVNGGDTLYKLYLDNALWYPGTGRTFDAYLGTLFRKPSTKTIPSQMAGYEDVFTSDGQTMDGFAAELAGGMIKGFRPGVLIDYPDIDSEGMSLAELEDAGGRPYATMYPADRIMNWEQSLSSGKLVTSRVTLEERLTLEKAKGKYDIGSKEFATMNGYAIFRRVLSLSNGVYTQALYVKAQDKTKKTSEFVPVESKAPTMNGEPMGFIPFIPVTPKGLVWDLNYPLINDIAVLNIADYRNEALYRDALLFNGRPTPCVSGLIMDTPNQKSVVLGSSSILQFDTDGKWGMLGGGADSSGLKESGS
jgi:hypothetical protein